MPLRVCQLTLGRCHAPVVLHHLACRFLEDADTGTEAPAFAELAHQHAVDHHAHTRHQLVPLIQWYGVEPELIAAIHQPLGGEAAFHHVEDTGSHELGVVGAVQILRIRHVFIARQHCVLLCLQGHYSTGRDAVNQIPRACGILPPCSCVLGTSPPSCPAHAGSPRTAWPCRPYAW